MLLIVILAFVSLDPSLLVIVMFELLISTTIVSLSGGFGVGVN